MALLSMSQMMSRPSWATDSRMLASEGWGSSTYTSSYHTKRTSYRKTHMQTLDKLCTWARNWGMEFNVTKCHVGKHNKRHTYSMDWIALARTEERDIAVVLSDHLKPTAQCKKAAKTANAVLGQILGAFHFRDRHTFLDLYQQQVRPEAYAGFWRGGGTIAPRPPPPPPPSPRQKTYLYIQPAVLNCF